MSNFTSIDLFCGAGGLTEGFRQAGFKCLYANDCDADAIATFNLNHPGVNAKDEFIDRIEPAEVRSKLALERGQLDCLIGGPPCQGFSINAPGRTLSDPRNALVRKFLDFAKEFEPKRVLIENVPGLLSLSNGQVLDEILEALDRIGYQAVPRILLAAHYGVPQERWRLIVLASRHCDAPPKHPEPTHNVTARANFRGGKDLTLCMENLFRPGLEPVNVGQAIGDLPMPAEHETYEGIPYGAAAVSPYAQEMRQDSDAVTHHFAAKLGKVNRDRLAHIGTGGNWLDIPKDLLPAGMRRARRSDHTKRYGRLDPNKLSGTVLTKMDPHWGAAFHYDQDRVLTVREAARLQSFPDRYRFCGNRTAQYRQVGNAVPVLLAKAIALEVKKGLDGDRCAEMAVAACR